MRAHNTDKHGQARTDTDLEGWTALHYRKALNELIRDVDPRGDAPGRWAAFLRETVRAEIGRKREEMSSLDRLFDPVQQERYNRLAGEIKGLSRLLLDDFGIGAALAAKIEEQ